LCDATIYRYKALEDPAHTRDRLVQEASKYFYKQRVERYRVTICKREHCFAFAALHRSMNGFIMQLSHGHAVARRFLSPPPSSFGGFGATLGVALFFAATMV
jgi:hypothetical protein